jgi:RNA polymerase sigma-70 factor (ECF subfamily)
VPHDESDEKLMRRFQAGDARAFETLVRRHRSALWNFLLRHVGDRARAEDLLQDTLLRAVKASGEWVDRAKVTTWLFTIARNLATDEVRRAVHRRAEPLDGRGGDAPAPIDRVAADDPPPDAAAEGALLRPRLEAALAALPAEQREVFLLREQGGLGFREIAEVTGVPENTVKSRMRYALEGLRRTLATLGVTSEAMGGAAR